MICGFNACYDDLPVCSNCLPDLQGVLTARCVNCGRTPSLCQCTDSDKHRFAFFYKGLQAQRLIYYIKTNLDGRAMDFLAEIAVSACGIKPGSYDGVTYVPRMRKRVRRYGHDQAKEFAEAISKKYNIPLVHTLNRIGGKEQKLLSRSERLKNIIGRYSLLNEPDEKYKKLLIVDDIYTTGATMKACVELLRGKVARSVVSLTFAKTNFEDKKNRL